LNRLYSGFYTYGSCQNPQIFSAVLGTLLTPSCEALPSLTSRKLSFLVLFYLIVCLLAFPSFLELPNFGNI
jgi:hypothetical protein